MVLMNASKRARNQASIVNRPTCGGVKKAGTAPRVGWYLDNNVNQEPLNLLLNTHSVFQHPNGLFQQPSKPNKLATVLQLDLVYKKCILQFFTLFYFFFLLVKYFKYI